MTKESENAELLFWQIEHLFELLTKKFHTLYYQIAYAQNSKKKYTELSDTEIENFINNSDAPSGIANIIGINKPKKTGVKNKSTSTSSKEAEKKEHSLSEYLNDFVKKLNETNSPLLEQYHDKNFTVSAYKLFTIFSNQNDTRDKNELVTLQKDYRLIFFNFLGYQDVYEFLSKEIRTLEYKVFYYSHSKDKVREFNFTIASPNTRTDNKQKEIYRTIQEGFHSTHPTERLFGTLKQFQNSWISRLQDTNESLLLDITITIGDEIPKTIQDLAELEIFNGKISGFGSNLNHYSGECVFVKKVSAEKFKHYSLAAEKYLNLKRNRFIVNGSTFLLDNKLMINGAPIDMINHLAHKRFRILSASPDGLYFQSIFQINEDLTAQIKVPIETSKSLSPETFETFRCKISYDNILQNRLLIYAYTGLKSLYSTTVIKVPERGFDKKGDGIIYGAFCITDGLHAYGPVGSYFVMTPIPENVTECMPQVFSTNDILSLKDNAIEKKMVKKLTTMFNPWLNGWQKEIVQIIEEGLGK